LGVVQVTDNSRRLNKCQINRNAVHPRTNNPARAQKPAVPNRAAHEAIRAARPAVAAARVLRKAANPAEEKAIHDFFQIGRTAQKGGFSLLDEPLNFIENRLRQKSFPVNPDSKKRFFLL
jgi:hypothetical protein